jgi:spore germination protein
MRRTLSTGFLCATVLILMAVSEGSTVRASLPKRVSAHLVFWDQSRGFDTIVANHDVFSEISPFWYRVGADGGVVPYTTESGSSYEDPAILSFLRSRGILIVPTVANILDGVWNGPLVSRIVADPVLAAANISNLVDLAVTRGYDGIDLDYENLSASDRAAFTSFVNQLAAALHAQGKLLTVNVYAKTAEPGTWDGPKAQDWWAMGQAADQVRIMAYEYHWSTSAPGPISPINWVGDVLAFARSTIPAQKIMQGIPLYGYDWIGQSGVDHVWKETMALANQNAATVNWDPASASPWFEYRAGGKQHTVWFENALSTDAKLQLTTAYEVGGITLWRIGGEDPSTWSRIKAHLGGTGGAGDAVPPTVTVISPLEGAPLQKKQRIEALAADNVGVARVELYVNGALLASDTTSPYVAYWNTHRAAAGPHVIKAVAYDAGGNSAASSVTAYR